MQNFESNYLQNKYNIVDNLQSSERNKVYIVQDNISKQLFIKKVFPKDIDLKVLEILKTSPIKNTPKIHEIWEDEKGINIVEEFISGRSLSSIIDLNGVVSEKQVIMWINCLCDILNDLHNLKTPIIHRDIKPSNIMIADDGSLKLIDFDTSRNFKADAKEDTRLFGTPFYMSPEQYGFLPTDNRSDIFSVGRLMIYILSGQENKNWSGKKFLNNIIKKCCQLSPKDRYQNVRELKSALNYNKHYLAIKVLSFMIICVGIVFGLINYLNVAGGFNNFFEIFFGIVTTQSELPTPTPVDTSIPIPKPVYTSIPTPTPVYTSIPTPTPVYTSIQSSNIPTNINSYGISVNDMPEAKIIDNKKYLTYEITSDPTGAKVNYKGQDIGSTPVNIYVDDTKGELILTKDGYNTIDVNFPLSTVDKKNTTINFSLAKLIKSSTQIPTQVATAQPIETSVATSQPTNEPLQATTTPSPTATINKKIKVDFRLQAIGGIQIFVDGKYSGTGDDYGYYSTELKAGTYSISIRRMDFKNYDFTIKVNDYDSGLNIYADRLIMDDEKYTPEIYTVTSTPTGADVYYNDMYFGVTPTKIEIRNGGEYQGSNSANLKLILAGYAISDKGFPYYYEKEIDKATKTVHVNLKHH